MFTSGTAVTVGPIQAFYYENNEYSVPIDPELNSGKLAKELCDKLFAIMVRQFFSYLFIDLTCLVRKGGSPLVSSLRIINKPKIKHSKKQFLCKKTYFIFKKLRKIKNEEQIK